MKIFFLIPTFFFFCCGRTSPNENTISDDLSDSLTSFNIVLYFGDEHIEKLELNVYKKANKCFAENISPVFYYPNKRDSIGTIELNTDKVRACLEFIRRAKVQPKNCPEKHSSVVNYTISTLHDTIYIEGDCDWDNLNYFDLRALLFKEKFAEMELKRESILSGLEGGLLGKWYFAPLKRELKKGDILILSKTNNFHSDAYWEIGKDHSFKSSNNKVLDFHKTEKYESYVGKWDGNVYFEIQGGFQNESNGGISVANDGATFIVESYNDNVLKLRFIKR